MTMSKPERLIYWGLLSVALAAGLAAITKQWDCNRPVYITNKVNHLTSLDSANIYFEFRARNGDSSPTSKPRVTPKER